MALHSRQDSRAHATPGQISRVPVAGIRRATYIPCTMACQCSKACSQGGGSRVAIQRITSKQVAAEVLCQVHCRRGREGDLAVAARGAGCTRQAEPGLALHAAFACGCQPLPAVDAAAAAAALPPPVNETSKPQCAAAPSRVSSRASGERGPAPRAPQERHVCRGLAAVAGH